MGSFARLLPWALCAVLLLVVIRLRTAPPSESTQLSAGAPVARDAAERKHPNKNHVLFTPEQWKEAKDLLARECPHRMKHIETLEQREAAAKDAKELKRLEANLRSQRAFLVSAARDLMQLKDESPGLYPLRLREVHLEDQVYGDCMEYRHASKQAFRDRLKPTMVALVKVGFEVRKGRISLVENAISEQKKLLEVDEQNIDMAVDRRLEETIANAVSPKSKIGSTTEQSSAD